MTEESKVNLSSSTLTINEVTEYIVANVKYQITNNEARKASAVLTILGPPGIGKSEIFEELCKRNGWGLAMIYLTNTMHAQITGIPMVVQANGENKEIQMLGGCEMKNYNGDRKFVPWSCPDIFNFDNLRVLPNEQIAGENAPILMFIDDIHLAEKPQQRVLFQLATQKSINRHELPPNVALVMAGNRPEDRAGHQQMLAPVCNRLWFLEVRGELNTWINNFAGKHGIRTDIQMFLEQHPSLFMGQALESAAWPSPRSWTYASDQLTYCEDQNIRLTAESITTIMKGFVGPEAATEFSNYKILIEGWKAHEIFSGQKRIIITDNDSQLSSDNDIHFNKLTRMENYSLLAACTGYYCKIAFDCDYKPCKQLDNAIELMKDSIIIPTLQKNPPFLPMVIRTIASQEKAKTNNFNMIRSIISVLPEDKLEILQALS